MLWVRRCQPQSPKAEQGLRLLCAKARGLALAIPLVATRWQQRDSSVPVGPTTPTQILALKGRFGEPGEVQRQVGVWGSSSFHSLTMSVSVLRSLETLT